MLCCASVEIPATVWCWCCPYYIGSRLAFRDGQRWFPNSEEGIPGKKRAERLLASAISIDGRKEWTCKFCSESNVWTRWRRRRCYNDIPAGLRGKYRQAIAARTGDWSTGSSTWEEDGKSKSLEAENQELQPRLEALEKKEGEGAQGGQGLPFRRESGMEEECRMDMDFGDEIAANEQKRKLQKELRDIEKFSCVPKEFQERPQERGGAKEA